MDFALKFYSCNSFYESDLNKEIADNTHVDTSVYSTRSEIERQNTYQVSCVNAK